MAIPRRLTLRESVHGWQLSCGISGSLRVEWVTAFAWNTHINRIKEVRPTGILFSRHSDYSFARRHRNAFSVFVGDKVEGVKVRFTRRIAPLIKESCWHHSQRLKEEPGGSLLFEVEVSEPREVGWWVMQWGPEAEVLEPESLRREVAEMARGIVRVYENRQEAKGPRPEGTEET